MKKYLFTLIIIGLFYSCSEDFLNVSPEDQLSDATFWKTGYDATTALVGCYTDWEDWSNSIWADAMSDNLYAQFYDWHQIANGTWLPTSGLPWERWFCQEATKGAIDYITYSRIRKYNEFLSKVEPINMDPATKEIDKAEVRFLRAYDYFTKTQYYGDVPLVTNVLPIDKIPNIRTPVAEVQNFIIGELDTISSILPVKNNIQSGGHVTSGAAFALKARVELYTGKFNEAMIDAKKVIDMNCYSLNPDYRGMFLPGNATSDQEAILAVNYINNHISNTFILQMLLPDSYGGYSGLGVTKSLVDAYECTDGKTIDESPLYDPNHPFNNRDSRMDMTFLHPGMVWNNKIYNSLDRTLPDGSINVDYHLDVNACRTGMDILKYIKGIPISSVPSTYGTNIVIIRLAEMYLTYAEAAVETGQNEDIGLQLINKLRQRGNLPPATALTRDLVRRERRVELALEGLRLWDIKRWDIGSTVLNGPTYGSRDGSVNMTTGEVTWSDTYIKVDDKTFNPLKKYFLPIPQSMIDASGMTQNSGY